MPSIRLNLITTGGARLCLLEVDLKRFAEAAADASEERMLTHLSTLLPRQVYFTGESLRELRGRLVELRENRRSVVATAYVEEREADSQPRVNHEPRSQPDDVRRYRAERDQARAELQRAEKERDRFKGQLEAAERNVKVFAGQSAADQARNSELAREVEKLRADLELYRAKYAQSAEDVKDFRRRLRECERQLKKPGRAAKGDDVYG